MADCDSSGLEHATDRPSATFGPSSPWRHAWTVLRILGTAVVLFYVGQEFARRLTDVAWSDIQFAPTRLAAALAVLMLGWTLTPVAYYAAIKSFGATPPLRRVCAASWIAPVGKYLPGKVGGLAGAIWLLSRERVPLPVAFLAVFVVNGLQVVIGLVLSLVVALWPGWRDAVPFGWLGCLLLVAAGLVCLHPRVLTTIVGWVLRKTGRGPLPLSPRLRDYAMPALVMILQWALTGAALWLVARSLEPLSFAWLPMLAALNALAVTAGILAIVVPAGIGVREKLLLVALGPIVGAENAAIVAVLARLLQIVTDLALAALGLLILGRTTRKESPHA